MINPDTFYKILHNTIQYSKWLLFHPTLDEVALVMVWYATKPSDIVEFHRTEALQRICSIHRFYDGGQDGYDITLKHTDWGKLTCRELYAYNLIFREGV